MWREGILGAGRSAAPAACRSDGTASGCRLGRCSRVGVMRIAVVSLFPVMLREALVHGVLGRAIERGVLEVECIDPRDFATDVHRTVDDRPYGGGPGMVLKVEPLRSALSKAAAAVPQGSRRLYLGADGKRFDQGMAREARDGAGLVLVAGRYEGVDERFIERETDEQWSIGDYVLSGGELPRSEEHTSELQSLA